MGISSLGVGSSILTQDVLDQLRAADEATMITPINTKLKAEQDKQDELDVLDASMTNLIDAIDEIKSATLYDSRTTNVTGSSVSVTAQSNSDVQSFSLDVVKLATRQIEQSGSFATKDTAIATGVGSLNLNIDGQDFTIDYDDTTTLDDLKKTINDVAGDKVQATVVQIASGDYRLFLSSVDTGSTQDITMTDNAGAGSALEPAALSALTTSFDAAAVQTGIDAEFKYNNQTITRSSNTVSDLVTGLTITLKEVGASTVSVEQDREAIKEKMNSFVEKYNSTMNELIKTTKASTDAAERGVFSSDSSIKSMKSALSDMLSLVGGGVGSLMDYGFDVDKEGKLSFDSSVLDTKLDENPKNVEAFFSGGTYTKADSSTVELTGAFAELSTIVGGYTDRNATLDQLKESYAETISTINDRLTSMTERLNAKYEILSKQFQAYDAIISKINSASSMFVQMANAYTAAQNNG